MSVLFADLAGFTALANELDPEEVHALLDAFFQRVDRLVAEHGGHVDKHIGDCVMAVFGAPVSHGNDAARAVSAALAIRDAMPELSSAVGRQLAVHIGVAGGQVVASGTGSDTHREYTVTGDTVNLASRLTDAAAIGRDPDLADRSCRAGRQAGGGGCRAAGGQGDGGAGTGVAADRTEGARSRTRASSSAASASKAS